MDSMTFGQDPGSSEKFGPLWSKHGPFTLLQSDDSVDGFDMIQFRRPSGDTLCGQIKPSLSLHHYIVNNYNIEDAKVVSSHEDEYMSQVFLRRTSLNSHPKLYQKSFEVISKATQSPSFQLIAKVTQRQTKSHSKSFQTSHSVFPKPVCNG